MPPRRPKHRLPGFWLCIAAALALTLPLRAVAQEAAAPASETLVVADEVRALVAPVALYPDPLLAVVLQAAMFPVDVVQADRFIERYEADQTLEPSADWDPAVTALLGYPSLLAEMNEHLDWTQAMGDAVYDRLEDVQDAIQDLRQGAYAMGVLASNEVQDVVVTEGIVEIRPAAPDQISIPQYDGFALLGSLETVGEAATEEAKDAGAAEAASSGEAEVAGVAEQAEAEVVEEAAPVATDEAATAGTAAEPEVAAEAGYVEGSGDVAAASPDAYASSYAEPVGPTYAQPPVYAAPPPPVAYAPPASSGWGTAATFLGGAAVGGLLGYAIFDDDNDNDGGNNRRNDINIEDSTIVVGGSGDRNRLDQDQRNRVDAELRDRRDRGQEAGRRDRSRDVAALPGRDTAKRQPGQKRDISLPQRDPDRPAKVERKQQRGTKAVKAPKQGKGAVADIKRPSQTKKDAQRGKQSRERKAQRSGGRQTAQQGGGQRQAAAKSGGQRQALAPKGGKRQAQAKSDRGKKSRGGGGRRGRG